MLTTTILIERLISSKIAKKSAIIGCAPDEIALVQQCARGPLPVAYIEFLSCAGKGAGPFMEDIDIYYPKNLDLNEEANEMLEHWEDGKLKLPDRAFVFAVRAGEQFMFFVCDAQSDDPVVYHYSEGKGKFREIGRFWNLIEEELEMSERFRKEHPNSPFLKQEEGA